MSAIKEITGEESSLGATYAWLDSAILGAKGIPTVIYGVGGKGIHGRVEPAS